MPNVRDNNRVLLGLGFIGIGVLLLLYNLDIVYLRFSDIWPGILSLFAIISWINFARNPKEYDLLMPASIFTVYSALFWYTNGSHYYDLSELWPFFILGPSLGLWLMHFSPYKKKDHFVPAAITSIIGVFFLVNEFGLLYGEGLTGLVCILIGLLLIARNRQKQQRI